MFGLRVPISFPICAAALLLGGCMKLDFENPWRLPSWGNSTTSTTERAQSAKSETAPMAKPELAMPPAAMPFSPPAPMPVGTVMPAPATGQTAKSPALAVQQRLPWPLGYELRKTALAEDSAVATLRDAGLKGHGYAIAALAVVHERGIGTEANAALADMWLRLLREHALAGNVSAQSALGVVHRYGHGAPRDLAQARLWLGRADDKNDPIAAVELGLMARDGVGEPANSTKAAIWFKKAAERGSPAGAVELARAIETGQSATANPARAALLYDWAGRLGHGAGDFRLGALHREGKGVKQDLVEALARFAVAEKSATESAIHDGAAKAVADLRSALSPAQIAEAETRAEILMPR